jgi:hypothetical protein
MLTYTDVNIYTMRNKQNVDRFITIVMQPLFIAFVAVLNTHILFGSGLISYATFRTRIIANSTVRKQSKTKLQNPQINSYLLVKGIFICSLNRFSYILGTRQLKCITYLSLEPCLAFHNSYCSIENLKS